MKRNGLLAIFAALACASLVQGQEFQRILFFGNSIAMHAPVPSLGWANNCGMAASSPDKDCVHLVTQSLRKKGGALPATLVKNIADFERQYATYDAIRSSASVVGRSAAGRPNHSVNYARNGSKATAAAGTSQTLLRLQPWIHWTGTANGNKSGQTPATPRLKAAQNAGHTLVSTMCCGQRH